MSALGAYIDVARNARDLLASPLVHERALRRNDHRRTMPREADVELVGEPLLHYAARQEVVFWALERASSTSARVVPDLRPARA